MSSRYHIENPLEEDEVLAIVDFRAPGDATARTGNHFEVMPDAVRALERFIIPRWGPKSLDNHPLELDEPDMAVPRMSHAMHRTWEFEVWAVPGKLRRCSCRFRDLDSKWTYLDATAEMGIAWLRGTGDLPGRYTTVDVLPRPHEDHGFDGRSQP